MVSLMVPLLCWTLCISSVSAEDHVNVSAAPGQNVTLLCRSASSSAVIVVQWRRTNVSGYVLLYRDGQFDPENQNPSYQNRVDLLDREMKDGDVSLVLKNLMTDDTGLYQCQVLNEGSLVPELIRTVNLQVLPPENKDGGTKDGSIGLIVGLIVFAFAAVAVSFLIYKKQPACLRKKTSDPPVDL